LFPCSIQPTLLHGVSAIAELLVKTDIDDDNFTHTQPRLLKT